MSPGERPDARARALILAATCLGCAIVQMEVTVVNVAIKPIGSDLGGGVSGLQWVVSAYTIALVAGFAFFRIEARSAHPMVPLWLFRSPVFSAATAIGTLINIAYSGLIFVFSLYFQRELGYSSPPASLSSPPALRSGPPTCWGRRRASAPGSPPAPSTAPARAAAWSAWRSSGP